ncbi:MAG: hypothetical protein KDK66_04300 [Deltaproteobacteria bacterium]|nr:hypothetical protein [Deltaproteobacteria bacterium]
MLRLLFILFISLIILSLLRFFSLGKKVLKSFYTPPPSEANKKHTVLDTMVPCATCGTYNPKEISLQYKGLYFCEATCVERYRQA